MLARSGTSALWAISPEMRLKELSPSSRPDASAQLAPPVSHPSQLRRRTCSPRAASGCYRGRLPSAPGMGLAVVPGQDLAEAAGAIGERAVADLAACDRKMGNGDGQAARL
jgi:hypothetical protein